MARAKDDPAGEHILLQGEVAGDHSWKRPSMLTAAGRLPGTSDRSDNHLEWPHDDEGAWEEDHAWGDASIWAQDDQVNGQRRREKQRGRLQRKPEKAVWM